MPDNHQPLYWLAYNLVEITIAMGALTFIALILQTIKDHE